MKKVNKSVTTKKNLYAVYQTLKTEKNYNIDSYNRALLILTKNETHAGKHKKNQIFIILVWVSISWDDLAQPNVTT